MIKKDKMFIVSSKVDATVKNQSAIYDITIFKDYISFENYINKIPVIIDSLILTTDDLAFNNTNMSRVFRLLESPFIRIKGSIIYLIDMSYDLQVVNDFLQRENADNWVVYQGNLNMKFLYDIVSGEGRDSSEGLTDIVMIRMRKDEYNKQKLAEKYAGDGSAENMYETDEIILSNVPDVEEPNDVVPSTSRRMGFFSIVGEPIVERTLFAFLVAQYYSLSQRTLIMETDFDYHRLTDMVLKSGVEHLYVDVTELFQDISAVLARIKSSTEKLVFVGTKKRMNANYSFLMDFLQEELKGFISCVVRECDFSEAPYGKRYSIVVRNNLPDILRSCNLLEQDFKEDDVTFIGVQLGSLGQVNVTSKEMCSYISIILEKQEVACYIVNVSGINLKGDGCAYDISSVIKGDYIG